MSKSKENDSVRRRNIQKPSINIFKLLSLILILVFIYLIPTVIKKLIIIKSIDCHSQIGDCPEELTNYFSYLLKSDYKYAKSQIEKFLDNNFTVKDYLVQYQIPSTVRIDLVVKTPKFAIKSGNYFYLIADDSIADTSSLPSLILSGAQFKPGEYLDKENVFALEILNKVSVLFEVVEAKKQKEGLTITLKNTLIIYFPLRGDADALIGALRLIYSRLNEENKGIRMENIREIDLRYKNPVLR